MLCEPENPACSPQICLRIKGFEHAVGRRPSRRYRARPIFRPSSGVIQENFRRSRRVGRVGAECERVGAHRWRARGPATAIWAVRPPKSTGCGRFDDLSGITPTRPPGSDPRPRADSANSSVPRSPAPPNTSAISRCGDCYQTDSRPTFSRIGTRSTGNDQRTVAKLLRHAQHTPIDTKVRTH